MTGRKFSKTDAIKFGWDTTTGNLGLLVLAIIIVTAIGIMPAVASDSWVVMAVAWVFDMIVGMGVMRMALRFVDGEKGELVDLFSTFTLMIPYLIASFMVGLVVIVGFCLLILPGIFWAVRLYMFPWVIVDKQVGPFEAMRRSWALTEGSFWNLFLLGVLLAGINILGAIALLLGLLVTIPLSVLAVAYVYRRLDKAAID
jgi:uncharacterized membrane protein